MEEQRMKLAKMGRSLDDCVDSELPDESRLLIRHDLLLDEAKLGCITAMLTCLGRRQRLAVVLGEILASPAKNPER